MSEQEKTEIEKALEQLTPREAEVLRKRFGLFDETKKPESMPTGPPDSDENGGSGGVPAPAKPPL